ncbi:MAG: ligD [Alphaproteobacteria bacterium]|nr:ligD [Alphaproteobacteria bacterium]
MPDVKKPDRISIDLDRDEGLGFDEVKRTAFDVYDGLAAIGLESFPLLTGGKGLTCRRAAHAGRGMA